MGKSTISMAIFNSYVSSPEGTTIVPFIHVHFPAQNLRCHGPEDGGTGSAEVGNSAAGTTPRTQWAQWIPINLWIHGVSDVQTKPGRGGRHFEAFLLIPTIYDLYIYMHGCHMTIYD